MTSQQGVERARKIKKRLIISLAVCVIVYVLFGGIGSAQQALNDFAQLPPVQQRQYPQRSQYYVNKMWYASSQGFKQVIIVNINEAELNGDLRELSTDGALQYFAQLSQMTRVYRRQDFKSTEDEIALRRKIADDDERYTVERRLPDIWIAQQHIALVRDLWWQQGGSLRSEFDLRAKLKDKQITHYATEDILRDLRSFVLDKEAAEILAQLFLANDHNGEPSLWQEKMRTGTIPRKLYIQNFKGDNGMRLLDTGK
ncbi:MAG: hypothetical protein HRU15_09595, partial [Planctomycetes bacterium]|nr:hypothetical protein [Planctomycetota bacterium]